MSVKPGELQLGKGSGFVKTKLRLLPQVEDIWEAAFHPIPARHRDETEFWLGMVVEQKGGGRSCQPFTRTASNGQ